VTGTIALHGGGEFEPGDEPFLAALLGAAQLHDRPLRVAIVPTAAARGRPGLAAANGVTAFSRVAASLGVAIEAEPVLVVDAASAADAGLAARLDAADVIHLPGGDPDLIPTIYPDTRAWAAIQHALVGGAVLAGASAGAMALGELTWTPAGLIAGLRLVPGIVVVPHADERSWGPNLVRFGGDAPPTIGVVGVSERTGVLISGDEPWRVVGQSEVRWLAPGVRDPAATLVLRDGDTVPRRS
jgi:cyanophycinase-like exopeptidase